MSSMNGDLVQLSNLEAADYDASATLGANGSSLKTGDLRRKYNFGDRVSELAIAQDPFFRFLSKVAKKPTDDPQFKFTEKRHSFHKRYAYVTAHGTSSSVSTVDATVTASNIAVDDVYFFKMEADYKNSGNITSVYGNSNNQIAVGASGTLPGFFMRNQVVKINFNSTSPSLTSSNVISLKWKVSLM